METRGIEEANKKVTPVIVVGMNRSGTRWFSTLLCKHPALSGIRAITTKNPGALAQETNMFSIFPRMYGDITDLEKYVALVEQWSTTLFFSFMQVEKEELYDLRPRPRSCYSLFAIAMGIHAEKVNTQFWVQKTTPSSYTQIVKHLPDAKYIAIKRCIVPNIKSKLKHQNSNTGNKRYNLAKLVFLYVSDAWTIKNLLKDKRISSLEVNYEDLVSDNTKELAKVCDFLGLEYSSSMLKGEVLRNTRFLSTVEKKEYLSRRDIFRIKILEIMFRVIPGKIISKTRRKYASSGNSKFINATFRALIEKNNLE